jgi:hypothetical protein
MDTDRLLRYELERLRVVLAVLEIDIAEGDIRKDGWIRADARPRSPRVVVSFEHPKLGALRYPCDQFHDWQDNVRAIALALEALRTVDRYGVTKHAEQYAGWKALPPATSTSMTAQAAAQFLAKHGGDDQYRPADLLRNPDMFQQAYRRAALRLHPDMIGGTVEAFQELQTAKTVLEAHHA